MIKDAEANKEADEKKKEEVDIRNQADATINSVKKVMESAKDKLSKEEIADIEDKIKQLEEAIKSNNIDDIKKKTSDLLDASHKIAEKIYAQPKEEDKKEEVKKDDDVIDAEYTETK